MVGMGFTSKQTSNKQLAGIGTLKIVIINVSCGVFKRVKS